MRWPVRVCSGVPVARSHTITAPSSPPVTARLPSSVTATARTVSRWPVRVCSAVPAARSHKITAPPWPPVTARVPSPVTATAQIGVPVAGQDVHQ